MSRVREYLRGSSELKYLNTLLFYLLPLFSLYFQLFRLFFGPYEKHLLPYDALLSPHVQSACRALRGKPYYPDRWWSGTSLLGALRPGPRRPRPSRAKSRRTNRQCLGTADHVRPAFVHQCPPDPVPRPPTRLRPVRLV
jgi:hypothetical protein